MKRPLWIALWAILLLGGGEMLAIYFMTAGAPPGRERGSPPGLPFAPEEPSAPAAQAPAPVGRNRMRSDSPAAAPAQLPRVVSEGRDGLSFSPDPEARGLELEAVRAQRKQEMMGFLNRRAERAAAERAASGRPGASMPPPVEPAPTP